MSIAITESTTVRSGSTAVQSPPLESGDRLSRSEFERRYGAMSDHKKAELIEGVVYLASPVGRAAHGTPHADLICWLGMYRAATPGVVHSDNSTVVLHLNNVVQHHPVTTIEVRPPPDTSTAL